MKTKKVGRPPISRELRKIPVGYKLPMWLVAWIRSQKTPASALIEEAIKKVHGLKSPKGDENV